MKTAFKRALQAVARIVRPDAVACDGSTIPAKHLRFGGEHFRDDRTFLESGEAEARRLVGGFGLSSRQAILELGCGTGRLAIGLLRVLGPDLRYLGVDVSQTAVDWCVRTITRRHPQYRFVRMDVRNARYNPEGLVDATHVRLPVADASIDVVYLYSVFSHMGVPDVRAYLREFRRIIKPGGGLFLTAFLERDVPDATVNPPDYRAAWHGALHCVRFERGFFERLLQEHGFSVSGVTYATETDGQSAVTARAVEHSPVVRAQSTSHTPSR